MVRNQWTHNLRSYQNFINKIINNPKKETMNKLQKFTNPVITQTTYSGEAASGYIAAALLSANTLDKKLVTIMPNVKYKSVIQKLATAGIVQDASCDFTTSGSVTITEQILTPKELQVNLLLCKQEFVASWEALQLGFSAFDEIPKNFNDFLISYVGGTVAQATEENIWAGTATNGSFTGFQTLFSASVAAGGATAVLPARTTGGSSAIISGSVTSANVISILSSVYQTIPKTVFGKPDLLIYVSTDVARDYQSALAGGGASGLGANGFNNQLNVGEKPMNFQGIEMVMCPGMGTDKIVAAQKSNLFFGTGLLSDYNETKVIDMANIDGSQNYRIVMRFTSGVQFGVGQDIVYYGAY